MSGTNVLLRLLNAIFRKGSFLSSGACENRKALTECEIVVVGNIRNGAEKIIGEIEVIRLATKNFKKVSFFVVESDSSDETIIKLQQIAATTPNFSFVSLGALSAQMPKRTERLAHCRNRALNEVLANKRYSLVDYVAVADLDGVNGILSADAIQSCWDAAVDWDVVTANQQGLYYDIWTLRHPSWCPVDCWEQYRALLDLFGHDDAQEIAVASRMVHLDQTVGFVEVDSAFGGFGIYKKSAFISGKYGGLDKTGNEISDHIPFHADLKKKGFRIYINAGLINAVENDYTALKRQRTRDYASSAHNTPRISFDENGDLLYRHQNISLRLPQNHLLPFYQQKHPLYNRFLPHLASRLSRGEIVVDVGANCGDSLAAMCCSNPKLRYVCIEPDPIFFSYLTKNKRTLEEVYPLTSIELAQCLVGKKVKPAHFAGHGGTKSAVKVAEPSRETSDQTNVHEVLSLDEIVDKFPDVKNERIRLIKSDTDGFDHDVLDSAWARLTDDRPILFFNTQFSDQEQRRNYLNLFENLLGQGYTDFWIFDNFGNFMLRVNRLLDLSQLLDYVDRQHRAKATKTIFHFDILSCTTEDTALLETVVGEYAAID